MGKFCIIDGFQGVFDFDICLSCVEFGLQCCNFVIGSEYIQVEFYVFVVIGVLDFNNFGSNFVGLGNSVL